MRYERDGLTKANPRLASERTVFVDDAEHATRTSTPPDFDGLGHYRTATTAGNFAAGNVRTTYTDYNPGAVRHLQPATSSPGCSNLHLPDRDRGRCTAKTESCFEAGTGYLHRARTLKSGTARAALPTSSPASPTTPRAT